MDGYDFPTLWQGNAYEYSLYLKTRNSDLLEINLGSKIFGKWCVASVDLGAHLIEPKILHSTPIPGVSHIKESIIRKNE
ncbi:MAG: hypothetical protein LUG50_12900 [Planctomycetaceae bacterium]|nr:hypothetical protein [Planctomycetaceae bacterium]